MLPPIFQLDVVANGDRLVEQDDDAGDEIRSDRLKPEAQPDTNRPAKDRQCGEIDADDLQQQQGNHHKEHDLEKLRRQLAGACIKLLPRPDDPLAGRVRNAPDIEKDRAENYCPHDRVSGDIDVAQLDRDAFQERHKVIQHAENMEDRCRHRHIIHQHQDERGHDEAAHKAPDQDHDTDPQGDLRNADSPEILLAESRCNPEAERNGQGGNQRMKLLQARGNIPEPEGRLDRVRYPQPVPDNSCKPPANEPCRDDHGELNVKLGICQPAYGKGDKLLRSCLQCFHLFGPFLSLSWRQYLKCGHISKGWKAKYVVG